jgi:hypothetical protein
MASVRMRSQQPKGGGYILQHVAGEARTALAGQIVSDLAKIVLALGRYDLAARSSSRRIIRACIHPTFA